jgi:hypothetical protein
VSFIRHRLQHTAYHKFRPLCHQPMIYFIVAAF